MESVETRNAIFRSFWHQHLKSYWVRAHFSYAGRYIGRLKNTDLDLGLYDIYDDRSAEQIRLMKQTRHAFDKAMELYEKGFYYEAKNLYACVLRENPGDMAAKYYIFRCEALQEKNQ